MTQSQVELRPHPAITLLQIAAAGLGGALLSASDDRDERTRDTMRAAAVALLAAAVLPALGGGVRAVGARRRRIRVQREICIERPVRELFTFCRDFENFPRIIQSLSRVIDYQDGRSHWEARTPRGALIAWDCVVTKYVPNVVIAWEAVEDGPVQFCGVLRFRPKGENATVLTIEIQYDPLRTDLRDALHAIVDGSRSSQLEGDLARANFHLRALPSQLSAADAEADAAAPAAPEDGAGH